MQGRLSGILLEAARYLSGCPRSRLHQRAALRDLDDRLLLDIGTTRREAGGRQGRGMTAPSLAAAVTCKEKPALTVNDSELARRAEEAGLNALPAPRQVLLDGWLLRFADGCTRRANSVNPLWPGGALDTDARIRRCAALYAAQGLPCLFRVLSFQSPGLDAALDAHGFDPPEGKTRILFRSSFSDLDEDGADGPNVELAEGQLGAEWLDAQARIAGDTARMADARRAMLAGLAIPAAFGAVRFGGPGTPLASLAYAAVHDGLACINMVATDPVARRRGLSLRVLLRLLAWAREAGAEGACLQVAADNAAAIPLYEGLGFRTELYHYHYRRLGG